MAATFSQMYTLEAQHKYFIHTYIRNTKAIHFEEEEAAFEVHGFVTMLLSALHIGSARAVRTPLFPSWHCVSVYFLERVYLRPRAEAIVIEFRSQPFAKPQLGTATIIC